jgi:hypothetical protein
MWLAFAILLAALPTPEGWRQESFKFPLQFAPTIPYEGTEHVRFAPGWGQFGSDTGFSYVFLWELKAKPVTTEDLEDYLETYFSGLMKGVAPARDLEAPKTATAVSLHPMTAIAGWAQSYGAQVRTWNAFSKAEPLLLHGEIVQRECPGGSMQILFAFSKAPSDRPIWKSLRGVREATQCPAGGLTGNVDPTSRGPLPVRGDPSGAG